MSNEFTIKCVADLRRVVAEHNEMCEARIDRVALSVGSIILLLREMHAGEDIQRDIDRAFDGRSIMVGGIKVVAAAPSRPRYEVGVFHARAKQARRGGEGESGNLRPPRY